MSWLYFLGRDHGPQPQEMKSKKRKKSACLKIIVTAKDKIGNKNENQK